MNRIHTQMNTNIIYSIIEEYDMQTAMFYMLLLSNKDNPLSISRMAKLSNTSTSTVKRWIKSLSNKNYIVVNTGTSGNTNNYLFPKE